MLSENLPLKLKRGFLFAFSFALFLIPGQNYYLTVQSFWHPAQTRQIEVGLPMLFYPINFTDSQTPQITAQSVLVMDVDSAVALYAKNENDHFLPASTVKMMTALVALEQYQLDEILKVNKTNGFGQDMELVEGEEISVNNLLYGLLVSSANDAALVLAQNYPGGKTAFVARMNQKAQELHLENTYFANPTGLDTDEEDEFLADFSYTTALDLVHLSRWALKNETFKQMVAIPQITVTDVSGRFKHQLYNINALLTSLTGTKGVKTGWTEQAGECLVSLVERHGRGIVTVVLGSQDRFGETTKLIEWVFANHQWKDIAPHHSMQDFNPSI